MPGLGYASSISLLFSCEMAEPVVLYRRSTHDSRGLPMTLKSSQEEAWTRHYLIGSQLKLDEFVSGDELEAKIRAYCACMKITAPITSQIVTALEELIGQELVVWTLETKT